MGNFICKKSKVMHQDCNDISRHHNTTIQPLHIRKNIIDKIEKNAFEKVNELHKTTQIKTHKQYENALIDIIKTRKKEYETIYGNKFIYSDMRTAFG